MSSMNSYNVSTLTLVCRLSIMILMHLHFESVLENVRFLRTLAYMGRIHPKGVPFLVEVYERVRRSVIWVYERAQRANR